MEDPNKDPSEKRWCRCNYAHCVPGHFECLTRLLSRDDEHFEKQKLFCCSFLQEATKASCRDRAKVFRKTGVLPSSRDCHRLYGTHPEWFRPPEAGDEFPYETEAQASASGAAQKSLQRVTKGSRKPFPAAAAG